jgi:hypothetical protein
VYITNPNDAPLTSACETIEPWLKGWKSGAKSAENPKSIKI